MGELWKVISVFLIVAFWLYDAVITYGLETVGPVAVMLCPTFILAVLISVWLEARDF